MEIEYRENKIIIDYFSGNSRLAVAVWIIALLAFGAVSFLLNFSWPKWSLLALLSAITMVALPFPGRLLNLWGLASLSLTAFLLILGEEQLADRAAAIAFVFLICSAFKSLPNIFGGRKK